jgi:hypothetical protein
MATAAKKSLKDQLVNEITIVLDRLAKSKNGKRLFDGGYGYSDKFYDPFESDVISEVIMRSAKTLNSVLMGYDDKTDREYPEATQEKARKLFYRMWKAYIKQNKIKPQYDESIDYGLNEAVAMSKKLLK